MWFLYRGSVHVDYVVNLDVADTMADPVGVAHSTAEVFPMLKDVTLDGQAADQAYINTTVLWEFDRGSLAFRSGGIYMNRPLIEA